MFSYIEAKLWPEEDRARWREYRPIFHDVIAALSATEWRSLEQIRKTVQASDREFFAVMDALEDNGAVHVSRDHAPVRYLKNEQAWLGLIRSWRQTRNGI